MKKIVSFLFGLVVLAFASAAAAQNLSYPIAELGYCRDAKECYLYCEIPENKPACWSYGKYVLGARVLGQHTEADQEARARELGITFPIAELGNCANVSECRAYCERPENRDACFEFARKKGIGPPSASEINEQRGALLSRAKTELGCTSFESCKLYCEQNMDRCMEFARKHAPPEVRQEVEKSHQMLEQAKRELGCTSIQSCSSYCSNPNNAERCIQFAKKHAPPEAREQMVKAEEMMQRAKQSLGCDSFSSCQAFCQNPQNSEKCARFAQEQAPPEIRQKMQKFREKAIEQAREYGLPCDSVESCKTYCADNPNQCQQFSTPDGQTTIQIHKEESFSCSTEEECRRLCEQKPEACPGFQNSEDFKRFEEEPKKLEEFRSKYEGQGSPADQNTTYYESQTGTSSQYDPASECAAAGGTWTGDTCKF